MIAHMISEWILVFYTEERIIYIAFIKMKMKWIQKRNLSPCTATKTLALALSPREMGLQTTCMSLEMD